MPDPTQKHNMAFPPAFWAGITALIFLVGSFILAWFGWGIPFQPKPPGIKVAQAIVLAIWTVGIPIWFWIEYHWVGNAIKDWDEFKYSQELSSKVWLAVTSVLFLLYFWKDLK